MTPRMGVVFPTNDWRRLGDDVGMKRLLDECISAMALPTPGGGDH